MRGERRDQCCPPAAALRKRSLCPGKGKSMGKRMQKEYEAEPEFSCLYKYFFFFPEAKACDKTPIVNSWCVCVKKELGISRNTFPCNWVLSTQMICVVVLRLVGSQAVSNAKVCVFSPWLKPVCNRAQWWKQMSHPVHSAALHITHCLHTKRAGEEKGQKKVRGDHPPSLYLRPFLVIKAWSLYWTWSNCLGAKHLSQRRKSAWGSECR